MTVTKLVDEGDGSFEPDAGWDFTGSVSTSQGGYSWVLPEPPAETGQRMEMTNEQGAATFQWDTNNATATSTLRLSEELQEGTHALTTECNVTRITRRGNRVRRSGVTLPRPSAR